LAQSQKRPPKKAFGKSNQATKYYFHKAIQKHGRDNFEWTILYQSFDGEHTKNVMENHFITEYRTFNGFGDCNGYNLSLGGDGNLGRKHKTESIDKMRRSKTGKLTVRSRAVTTPHGKFNSLIEASLTTAPLGISMGMLDKRLTSPYFHEWFYDDSPKEFKVKMQTTKRSRRITTPKGEFSSITAAAMALGMLTQTIRCRLVNPNFPDWVVIDNRPLVNTPSPNIVRSVTTPEGWFESVKTAATASQLQPQTVRNRIHSERYPDWYYNEPATHKPTRAKPTRTTVRTRIVSTPLGIFIGLEAASAATGLQRGTIRYRVGSNKYPDWQYVNKSGTDQT
jgi:hypothetical protein